jgi:hypothetical protein
MNDNATDRAKAARRAAKKAAKRAEKAAAAAAQYASARERGFGDAPAVRPIFRGQNGANLFKAGEDRIEKARQSGTRLELRKACREVGAAKLLNNVLAATENRRYVRGQPAPIPLFRSTPESDMLALAGMTGISPSNSINEV